MAKKSRPDMSTIVKSVRGLAVESAKAPKGKLRAAKERDQSRHNAHTEKEVNDLLEKGLPDKHSSEDIETVEEVLRHIGMPEDTDPNMEFLPGDELEDIVCPVIHPTMAALMKKPRLLNAMGFDSMDEITNGFAYTMGGNLLTVRINTSYPNPMILKAVNNLLRTVKAGKKRGWNISKAPEMLKALRLRGGGSVGSMRRKVAARIILGNPPVPRCDECPKSNDCPYIKEYAVKGRLCDPLEEDIRKGAKYQREKTNANVENRACEERDGFAGEPPPGVNQDLPIRGSHLEGNEEG